MLGDTAAPGKEAVFPRWKNADVVKTDRYALTTWTDRQGRRIAEMMFDHENDRAETRNLAQSAENAHRKREMRSLLPAAESFHEPATN